MALSHAEKPDVPSVGTHDTVDVIVAYEWVSVVLLHCEVHPAEEGFV